MKHGTLLYSKMQNKTINVTPDYYTNSNPYKFKLFFTYTYWKDKLQSDKLAFKRFDMEWLGCSSFYADVDYPCKQKQDACDVVGFCKRPNATRTWRAAYTAAIYRSSFVCFRINGDTAARACSSVQRCPRRRSDARELLVGFTPTLLHGLCFTNRYAAFSCWRSRGAANDAG